MIRILVMVGYYLPGYRAGGPVRSLSSIVEYLGEEFSFTLFTRDRDLGDTGPYENIVPNVWQNVGKARVMYLSPDRWRLWSWRRCLASADHDILYLNSFFDKLSVQAVFLRRLGLIPQTPTLVAPRGEFSPGALALKRAKKRLYMRLSGSAQLYRDVIWQATSTGEQKDIATQVKRYLRPTQLRILQAPNLPPKHVDSLASNQRPSKESNAARLVFVSRIARMKHLDFALRLLADCPGDVTFDIYGPAEDLDYWQECQAISAQLPANVKAEYHGGISSSQVAEVFSSSHLLLLPTHGENFGHVILEALRAGCPVLISDRTPWRGLAERKAGWDLPLDREDLFRKALVQLVGMEQAAFDALSLGARELGDLYAQDPTLVQANRQLFLSVLGRS